MNEQQTQQIYPIDNQFIKMESFKDRLKKR
jgi:hypothetical protein